VSGRGRIVALIAVALVSAACGGDTPGASTDPSSSPATSPATQTSPLPTTSPGRTGRTVDVVDNSYVPAELNVTAGTEVIWIYVGPDAPHTVTATDGSFNSHPDCPNNLDECMKAKGETFAFTFPKPGRFTYSCNVHGELMSGAVVVE
jgi:plastocyanin